MKNTLILLASLAVATATLATAAVPGLAVGTKAPDFTLKNAAGADVSLKSLTKAGPVALVFYRSADWCPFCKKQLQALQADLKKVEMSGVRVVGISYDAPATSASAAAKLGLSFPLLSDTGSKVIDAYGIRNTEAKGKAAGVAHPVVFIVDGKGVIRAKLGRDGYKDRPESAEIIAAAKGLM
ncbi:MAG: peroxiredoxin family protein [Opitutaceae bacterium]|nr:peroxiredoxin family protein [Opitutaceae bacterium]